MSLYFLVYIAVILLSALPGLLRFRQITVSFKILTVFLVMTFTFEATTFIFSKNRQSFIYLYHIYVLLNSLSYIIITYCISSRSPTLKKISVISGVSACILSALNLIFYQPWKTFPSYMIYCNIIFSLLFSILIFYYLLTFPEEYSILRNPAFWFAAANPIFQIVTCIYILFNHLDVMKTATYYTQQLVANTHLIFAIFMYAIYGFAIYLDSIRPKK